MSNENSEKEVSITNSIYQAAEWQRQREALVLAGTYRELSLADLFCRLKSTERAPLGQVNGLSSPVGASGGSREDAVGESLAVACPLPPPLSTPTITALSVRGSFSVWGPSLECSRSCSEPAAFAYISVTSQPCPLMMEVSCSLPCFPPTAALLPVGSFSCPLL